MKKSVDSQNMKKSFKKGGGEWRTFLGLTWIVRGDGRGHILHLMNFEVLNNNTCLAVGYCVWNIVEGVAVYEGMGPPTVDPTNYPHKPNTR